MTLFTGLLLRSARQDTHAGACVACRPFATLEDCDQRRRYCHGPLLRRSIDDGAEANRAEALDVDNYSNSFSWAVGGQETRAASASSRGTARTGTSFTGQQTGNEFGAAVYTDPRRGDVASTQGQCQDVRVRHGLRLGARHTSKSKAVSVIAREAARPFGAQVSRVTTRCDVPQHRRVQPTHRLRRRPRRRRRLGRLLGRRRGPRADGDIVAAGARKPAARRRRRLGTCARGPRRRVRATQVLRVTTPSTGPVQVGTDIAGEARGDWCGGSVALSQGGVDLAAGCHHRRDVPKVGNRAGQAGVFHWDETSWEEMGEAIDGEAAGDEFGGSVSLASTTMRLCSTAPTCSQRAGLRHGGTARRLHLTERLRALAAPVYGLGENDRLGRRRGPSPPCASVRPSRAAPRDRGRVVDRRLRARAERHGLYFECWGDGARAAPRPRRAARRMLSGGSHGRADGRADVRADAVLPDPVLPERPSGATWMATAASAATPWVLEDVRPELLPVVAERHGAERWFRSTPSTPTSRKRRRQMNPTHDLLEIDDPTDPRYGMPAIDEFDVQTPLLDAQFRVSSTRSSSAWKAAADRPRQPHGDLQVGNNIVPGMFDPRRPDRGRARRSWRGPNSEPNETFFYEFVLQEMRELRQLSRVCQRKGLHPPTSITPSGTSADHRIRGNLSAAAVQTVYDAYGEGVPVGETWRGRVPIRIRGRRRRAHGLVYSNTSADALTASHAVLPLRAAGGDGHGAGRLPRPTHRRAECCPARDPWDEDLSRGNNAVPRRADGRADGAADAGAQPRAGVGGKWPARPARLPTPVPKPSPTGAPRPRRPPVPTPSADGRADVPTPDRPCRRRPSPVPSPRPSQRPSRQRAGADVPASRRPSRQRADVRADG